MKRRKENKVLKIFLPIMIITILGVGLYLLNNKEANVTIADGQYVCHGIEYAVQTSASYVFKNGTMFRRTEAIEYDDPPHDSNPITYSVNGNIITFRDPELEKAYKDINEKELKNYFFTYYEKEKKIVSNFDKEVYCERE